MPDASLPALIGHYRLERTIGSGGMGTVIAARDERLQRPVALKLLHRQSAAATAVRLWREARAAAAVRHPAVCQVFDVGEAGEHLYIAMELLEGETLAARLQRGPIPVGEAIDLALALLDAIQAIHAQGLLHRDLKPANLMLTAHGLKVLDFGLARPPVVARELGATGEVTLEGTVLGTPSYLAPEVLDGVPPDVRSDIFAAGAVLFETLAARPAFPGATPLAIAHAVLHEQPPALTGGPAVAALDRVIRQALSKNPALRFESAAAMAAAVRAIRQPDTDTPVTARATRRIIVLPFRVLRPDDDAEFLAASLPDAVTATLSQLDSVVVRSSLVGARVGPSPDLQRLAADADVDLALTGTLFRAGGEIRLQAQLVEVPGGAVLQSSSFRAPAHDVIELHDSLVSSIAGTLAGQLSAGEQARLVRSAPASPTAYALFLRANELARDRRRLAEAVERYRESLALDPSYAPGWAQLGRAYRLASKYESSPAAHFRLAREALDRALALDPDLDLAHSVYAQLEADTGQSRAALLRLTRRAIARPAAAEIYAGLVYACRFCGLAAESITFHHEAKRLDPGIATSVTQSYFQTGDYLRCLETAGDDLGYIGPAALGALGRRDDAVAELRVRLRQAPPESGARLLIESLLATLEGDGAAAAGLVQRFLGAGYIGCETQIYAARQLVHIGAHEMALAALARGVDGGFHHVRWLESDPWFAALRPVPGFAAIVAQARRERETSRAAFVEAGGNELLARQAE